MSLGYPAPRTGTSVKAPIRIEGEVAYVPLTQGCEAVIDVADVTLVAGWNWVVLKAPNGRAYAISKIKTKGVRKTIYMHRLVMGLADEKIVDHANRNGLDNRRSNLRAADKSMNARNACLFRHNTSGHKGVSWCKFRKRWVARIVLYGKSHCLGYHREIEAAAAAYARASAELHGEFGRVA